MSKERNISYDITVLRTGRGEYLESVWEEWNDDSINYSFTSDPLKAYKFYDYGNIPKYLWNDKMDRPIKTVEEMCELLKGELVKYKVCTNITLKKIKDENTSYYLRGHKIELSEGEWVYSDTKESTIETWESRPCGDCGLYNTAEGHDGCLGTLIGTMNACCGHGNDKEAYIQFIDGKSVRGEDAKAIQDILK